MLVGALEGHRIWSRTYDQGPNPVLALESRILSGLLGPLAGLRVIDVACGTGRSMAFFRAQGASAIGVDLSPEMLAVAARKPGLSGRLAQAHCGRLPFAEGAADLAFCSFALSYFPSPGEAVAELSRIVRTGGRVFVTDLHPLALQAGWKRSFRSGPETYEVDYLHHSEETIEAAAERCNLHRRGRIEAHFGSAEREIFQAAGKEEAYPEACRVPAILIQEWVRQ